MRSRYQLLQKDSKKPLVSSRKISWVKDQSLVAYRLEDREAKQTGRNEEASTMPQKKKARTCKARSANKQSEMLSPVPPYHKSSDVPEDLQHKRILQPCSK
ncbi:unnamed protein product [Arabis nemorensis]|uniref:Uncharacterized protein n=1 Tax=Arabis nemorensis TaxID=586526 RepID=A0A565CAS8_9BRAS|nr:unnamed protein product [Arabis nemorensis]